MFASVSCHLIPLCAQKSPLSFSTNRSIHGQSLFGMNVNILADNPDWRWFLLGVMVCLGTTICAWLIFKYCPVRYLKVLSQLPRYAKLHLDRIVARAKLWTKVAKGCKPNRKWRKIEKLAALIRDFRYMINISLCRCPRDSRKDMRTVTWTGLPYMCCSLTM
jgi:hypothetical protein